MVDPIININKIVWIVHSAKCTISFSIKWKYWFSLIQYTWQILELDLKERKTKRKSKIRKLLTKNYIKVNLKVTFPDSGAKV